MGAEALLAAHSVSETMDGGARELCTGCTYERKNAMTATPQHPRPARNVDYWRYILTAQALDRLQSVW